MKIKSIEIEQFGKWRNLELTLHENGLNVFYGPNEAGKSTLLRFIRGVLYGFDDNPHDGGAGRRAGLLRVTHGGEEFTIHRAAHESGEGLVSVSGPEPDRQFNELLPELRGGTAADVFENVFAFGLHELQELATLQGDDVAQEVYGVSLGPEGQRLLHISEQAQKRRAELVGDDDAPGRLQTLLEQEAELTAQIEQHTADRARHAELIEQRQQCAQNIDSLKERKAGLQHQLRGHRFLERVYGPWDRIRHCQTELRSLPEVNAFPEDGLARLDEIDEELDSLVKCRDTLLEEAAEFRREIAETKIDAELETHAPAIQNLVDERPWVEELTRRVDASRQRFEQLDDDLEARLDEFGDDWDEQRLQSVDVSTATQLDLTRAARRYQSALIAKKRLRKRYDRLSESYQLKLAELEHTESELGTTVEEALAEVQQALGDVEESSRLRLQESELTQRRAGIAEQLSRVESKPPLPNWVAGMLIAFGVVGLVFAGVGLYTGVTTSWLGGLGYVFLALTFAGGAWGLKLHLENEAREAVESLQDDLRACDERLRETTTAIGRSSAGAADRSGDEAAQVKRIVERLSELEQLAALKDRLAKRRRRLSDMRKRFQTVQGHVQTARREWCELLAGAGFAETLDVERAFADWQQLVEARELLARRDRAREELERHTGDLESFGRRIEQLGRRVGRWKDDGSSLPEILDRWDGMLKDLYEERRRRDRLVEDERTRRSEANEYQSLIDDLKHKRSALLLQGGAATREEFEERALIADRRIELENEIQTATDELDAAAKTEPELAIVESDLENFDAEANREAVATLTRELEDVELDLEAAFERAGELKQAIAAYENDRSVSHLRFAREQLRAEIADVCLEWQGVETAAQALRRVCERYERHAQPETLKLASEHLHRLSEGRHNAVWTPLGERRLRVDDPQGAALRVADLSGGAREQLFLAVRLALLESFAQRGVELPFILDDVLVNFDEARTEAAANRLMELTQQGQQILFLTCHLHLARLFENKGIRPFWLPSLDGEREERLAG